MRFRTTTTFNSHDTKIRQTDSGRVLVDQSRGVSARCELILNALLRFGPNGATAEMLAEHLNKRLKTNYSKNDLSYAMDRLVKEGLIKVSRGFQNTPSVWKVSQDVLTKWRKVK